MGIFDLLFGGVSEPLAPEPIVEATPNARPMPGDSTSPEIGTFHMRGPSGSVLQFIAECGGYGQTPPRTAPPSSSWGSWVSELSPDRLVKTTGTLDETYFAFIVELTEDNGAVQGHVYFDRPYDHIEVWSKSAANSAHDIWVYLTWGDGMPIVNNRFPRPDVHIDSWSTYMIDGGRGTVVSSANLAAWAEVGTFSTVHSMRTVMEIIRAALQEQLSSGEAVPTEPGALASIYVSRLTDDLIVVTAGNTVETYFSFSVQLSEDDSGTRGHAYWDRPFTEIKTWPGNAIDIKRSVSSVLGQASATLKGLGWNPGMPVDS
jgi:hypothetical protein